MTYRATRFCAALYSIMILNEMRARSQIFEKETRGPRARRALTRSNRDSRMTLLTTAVAAAQQESITCNSWGEPDDRRHRRSDSFLDTRVPHLEMKCEYCAILRVNSFIGRLAGCQSMMTQYSHHIIVGTAEGSVWYACWSCCAVRGLRRLLPARLFACAESPFCIPLPVRGRTTCCRRTIFAPSAVKGRIVS
jgi:hypothetical protein